MRNRQHNGNAMSDAPRHHCGVFGIFGDERAAEKTYLGLYALQHRGQESAGIAASDGHHVTAHKGMGLVSQVFTADVMARFTGRSAIGHNRYSTTGSSSLVNAQPIAIDFKRGPLAAGHNGNLVNAAELRARMEEDSSIFQTTTDSEIVLHLVARSKHEDLADMILEALAQTVGAYCFVFLSRDRLIAARDPKRLLVTPGPERIFHLKRAYETGMETEEIYGLTRIDPWFLDNIRQIVEFEERLRRRRRKAKGATRSLTAEELFEAKRCGFSDAQLATLLKTDEGTVRRWRARCGIEPAYKCVDTCAAEFEAFTPYYYSTYEKEDETSR